MSTYKAGEGQKYPSLFSGLFSDSFAIASHWLCYCIVRWSTKRVEYKEVITAISTARNIHNAWIRIHKDYSQALEEKQSFPGNVQKKPSITTDTPAAMDSIKKKREGIDIGLWYRPCDDYKLTSCSCHQEHPYWRQDKNRSIIGDEKSEMIIQK